MKSENVIKEMLKDLKHKWVMSDSGHHLFRSARWKMKGQIKALEWVLDEKA